MALFVIERNFAEQLHLTSDAVRLVTEVNGELGVPTDQVLRRFERATWF